jgi:hypothetical protein
MCITIQLTKIRPFAHSRLLHSLPLWAASYPQFLLLSVLGYAEGMKPLYPSYDHPLNTGTEYEQSGR